MSHLNYTPKSKKGQHLSYEGECPNGEIIKNQQVQEEIHG